MVIRYIDIYIAVIKSQVKKSQSKKVRENVSVKQNNHRAYHIFLSAKTLGTHLKKKHDVNTFKKCIVNSVNKKFVSYDKTTLTTYKSTH